MNGNNGKSKLFDIPRLIEHIQALGFFAGFERIPRLDYELGNALEAVTAIGKIRNPRFAIDEENRFAYENFIKWMHADPTMQALDPLTGEVIAGDLKRGVYLAGNTGSGKSWCLDIMQVYAKIWGFEIHLSGDKYPRPLYWATHRSDDICHEYATTGEAHSLKILPILGVHDFGQEPRETLYMGNRQNVLGQIIEARGDRSDLITLITSNLRISSDLLRSSYGDRVQSRLIEMCNYLEIKGKDRRLC